MIPVSDEGGPQVEIKIRDNGPYKVTGPVRLIDPDGGVFELTEGSIVLCRCGHSATKPFCDSSHKEHGFESCVRAAGNAPPRPPQERRWRSAPG